MQEKKRQKIGIALGCGTARGMAHIGVLKVFDKENIPIDFISGTSMGAIVGAIYASGVPAIEIERFAVDFRLGKIASPSFSKSGIFNGKSIEKVLKKFLGDKEFKDLKIPLSVVASDICSGDEVVFTEGNLIKALRASASMPGLFTPMPYKKTYLVDGGLLNPIPSNLLYNMGADITIAVSVNRNVRNYTQHKRDKKIGYEENFLVKNLFKEKSGILKFLRFGRQKKWSPNIIDVLLQAVYITGEKIAVSQMKTSHKDLLLSPELGDCSMIEFKKIKEIIKRGESAAYKALPDIIKLLK